MVLQFRPTHKRRWWRRHKRGLSAGSTKKLKPDMFEIWNVQKMWKRSQVETRWYRHACSKSDTLLRMLRYERKKKSSSSMEISTVTTCNVTFLCCFQAFFDISCVLCYICRIMSMRFTPLTWISLGWRLLIEPAMRSLWSSKPKSRWPQPMSRSNSWTSLQSMPRGIQRYPLF